jgi:hypothetical protein
MRIFALSVVLLTTIWNVGGPAEEHQMTLEETRQFYASTNREYFHGSLPKDVDIEFGSNDFISLDNILCHALGNTNKLGNRFVITIDPKWAPASVTKEETMLHEECHVATWDLEKDHHGKKWQSCMHDLYIQGALDDLL